MVACGSFENKTGIEEYNKDAILKEYGSDIDSSLFLFPDDTKTCLDAEFVSSLRTGLFDTEGYIIMNVKYNETDYIKEVARLASVSCVMQNTEVGVIYDEESYALPAYVAVDGFDYVYEYALMNDDNYEITYVLLSNHISADLAEYQAYLKTDGSAYEIEDALNKFSIYVRANNDGTYSEYSDITD
jgi:hypothetical protein